jgi:hypothetical protein
MEHIKMIKPLFVRAEWDEEASVWVATSDDGRLDKKAEDHHS